MKVLNPPSGFPAWGSGKGPGNPQGIRLWRPVGFDYRTTTGLGETETSLLEDTDKILCVQRPRGKEQWHHRILNQTSLLVLEGLLGRCGVSSGSPWTRRPWQQQSWGPPGGHCQPYHRAWPSLLVLEGLLGRCGSAVARHGHGGPGSSSPGVLLEVTINPTIELHRPQRWTASGETINREGAKPSPSVENWIKVLLSMALPIRARLSFSHHQSLLSGNLHRSLNLIHQTADRRSKKGHNPTAARPKTTSQKVNHDEKAEGFVPDEGTR